MDEKWSFVAKKEKNCDEDDPEDQFRGDCWDHVAFDPEHRLVVSVVPGERTGESVRELVTDVKERLGDRVPELITTDEYTAYEGAHPGGVRYQGGAAADRQAGAAAEAVQGVRWRGCIMPRCIRLGRKAGWWMW